MIYAVTVYCYLDPKLGFVVRKRLASLGMVSLKARWSSSSKNISEVKGYSNRDCSVFFVVVVFVCLFVFCFLFCFFPLVTPALSEPEEALILVW